MKHDAAALSWATKAMRRIGKWHFRQCSRIGKQHRFIWRVRRFGTIGWCFRQCNRAGKHFSMRASSCERPGGGVSREARWGCTILGAKQ